MPTKTAQDRLNDTFAYLAVMPGMLPLRELTNTHGTNHHTSELISLGGYLNRTPQERQRRRALRALLLCLCWVGRADTIRAAKLHYSRANETVIGDAIRSFFTITACNVQSIVKEVAIGTVPQGGPVMAYRMEPYRFRRGAIAAHEVPVTGNCYDACTMWLYMAGAVSLRWLINYGSQPGVGLPSPWNWEPEIDAVAAANVVPAGHILRFERGAGILHYAISVATNECIGFNQSHEIITNWPAGFGNAPVNTKSRFSIAGYLQTCLILNPNSVLRTAPVMPVGGMRF